MNLSSAKAAATRVRSTVLPHEWWFGGFLAWMGVRLLIAGGAAMAWSCVYLGGLAGCVAVAFWAQRKPNPLRWRVRLLYYPAVMGISFYAMKEAGPLLGVPKVDALLLAWDRALLGETPALAWEKFLRPWLVDLSMAAYLFFFYYLIAGPGRYCIRDLPLFRKCIVGLFTLYGLSFISYTVFPAGGPHRFMAFETPLNGPWLLNWTLKPVNDGSNCMDVFPSVHFAATLYLLLFDWRHHRRRFWWLLLPCLMLWFSTMYLRFHYFVDLLWGVGVALAGWFVAQRYARSAQEQAIRAEAAAIQPQPRPVAVTRAA